LRVITLHFTQIFFTDARTFIAFAALLCAHNSGAQSSFEPSAFSSSCNRMLCALHEKTDR
jgi:hypothetical protein